MDDVNRQPEGLEIVLDFLNSRPNADIKIVATVRDYAKDDVLQKCKQHKPLILDLESLSHENIDRIISEEPYFITDNLFKKQILRVAQGNARIAVMMCLLAKERQNLSALFDVEQVYEQYFELIAIDKAGIQNIEIQKTLGILSFFHTIYCGNQDVFTKILKILSMNENDFNSHITNLEKMEFVEISANRKSIRIADQSFSGYFFYKAFITPNLLHFRLLLHHFWKSHPNRFKDVLIPASNSLNSKDIREKISPDILDFWETIKTEEKEALRFLETFWFFRVCLKIFQANLAKMISINAHCKKATEDSTVFS